MDNTPDFSNGIALVWADLETTGLSYEEDVILEMTVQVTDFLGRPAGPPLSYLADVQNVSAKVRGRVAHQRSFGPDVVRNIHTKNGLWDEVLTRPVRGEERLYPSGFGEAVERVVHILRVKHPEINDVRIAGSTISFDKRFIETKMGRELDFGREVKSHRVFDLSTLRPVVIAKGFDPDDVIADPSDTHRAEDDVRRDIAQWQAMTDWLGLLD